jgi:hypothetical protein
MGPTPSSVKGDTFMHRITLSILVAAASLAVLGARPDFGGVQALQAQLDALTLEVGANTQALESIGGHEIVLAFSAVDTSTFKTVRAECPEGKVVLGGGGRITFSPGSGGVGQAFANNYPDSAGSWTISVRAPVVTELGWQAIAYAVCAAL